MSYSLWPSLPTMRAGEHYGETDFPVHRPSFLHICYTGR